MATQTTSGVDAYPALPVSGAMTREERCDQYRTLARAILELAWRDARPEAACSEATRCEAVAFVFSEDADFWAHVAGVNIAQIRRSLRQAAQPTRSDS